LPGTNAAEVDDRLFFIGGNEAGGMYHHNALSARFDAGRL
jgi:hypothetical protein